ncbi:apolipoprotein N-acyltransferase [Erythrobacter sp. HL-111]|uniref:apolipoprotein N-acyltransferase n=1 Tax=Erythrobacter sp. HL-111 TaxID=1798193 RepID=UPI0006DB0EB3|nr:apolipoprotein N-acyltransferase [Erythrobacter sp. HL-111]KPP94061.1 MAG: apolipoprotein N-acyltransferase Int [Erythrobacteraceae bacterium HL-111]SDS60281.1 apolipoprotein N-acyltransferase [Erythrobacter sp. HL-111]
MKDRIEAARQLAQRRPGLISLALGLVSACAFPPLHLWPLGLAALAALVWQLRAAPDWRAAAWHGYLFGWAHLTLANNWIATSFTHQAKMPEFLGWLAVPLLCVYLALYPALAALAAHFAAKRSGPLAFGTAFAGAWIIAEWIRSWAFTGYPWPPLGLMLLGGWDTPGIARLLPWLGTYALSGLAILLASALLWALAHRRRVAAGAMALGIVAAMLLPGPRGDATRPEDAVRYALVQPLIPQDEINDGSKFEEQFQRIARLTRPGSEQSRLVLWPESAIPDYLEDGYPLRYYARMTFAADPLAARARIAQVVGPDSTLLTGVVNLDIGEREDGTQGAVSARNSVLAIGGDGAIEAQYAKAHLVPYGEYLPMEWALERLGLSRLTAGTIAYVAGPGPRTLDLGEHGRAGIQICYEIIFSGHVTDPEDRPDYIFNPSNDGWFGSWGPPQHLAQARMRAIEEGLPVLRSTTTGISAVIDANGIVRGAIGRGKAGRLDGFVPQAKPPTVFARAGNALPLAWSGLLLVLALAVPRSLALRRARG